MNGSGEVVIINPNRTATAYPVQDRQPQQLPEMIGGWDDTLGVMSVPATSHTAGSHQDRAKGFAIATKHLSACSAVAIIPVAVVGFGFPLLSMPILAWMFGTYATVWALAYVWHQATSADGVSWFMAFYRFWIAHTGLRMSYRLIKADQKHRHEKEVRNEQ